MVDSRRVRYIALTPSPPPPCRTASFCHIHDHPGTIVPQVPAIWRPTSPSGLVDVTAKYSTTGTPTCLWLGSLSPERLAGGGWQVCYNGDMFVVSKGAQMG